MLEELYGRHPLIPKAAILRALLRIGALELARDPRRITTETPELPPAEGEKKKGGGRGRKR